MICVLSFLLPSSGDGLPVLFTLTHPLEDICPVTSRQMHCKHVAIVVYVVLYAIEPLHKGYTSDMYIIPTLENGG